MLLMVYAQDHYFQSKGVPAVAMKPNNTYQKSKDPMDGLTMYKVCFNINSFPECALTQNKSHCIA